MNRTHARIVALLVGSLCIPAAAGAGSIQLFSPRPLVGGGVADYTSTEDLVASPYLIAAGGNTLTFTLAVGEWRFAEQGVTFSGDFDPGTHLLYTNNNNFLNDEGVSVGGGGSGPIEIAFASGVQAFFVRAQTDLIGPETFTVSVYNGAALLGTFDASGFSGQRSDERFAVLLGARTTGDDRITRVAVSSIAYQLGEHPNRFAIAPVTFGDVPEPAAGVLLLLGIVLQGIRGRITRRC